MEERLKSHYESLSRAIWFTRTADSKAAPVLALQIALLGTLAARLDKLLPMVANGPWTFDRVALTIVILLYGTLLVSAVTMAARVYIPTNPRTGDSLIYFEDIAGSSCDNFRHRASSMCPTLIETQLIDQVHRVSIIASDKMKRIRCAYWLSAPSVAVWAVLLGWSSV